jgi:ribonuclease T
MSQAAFLANRFRGFYPVIIDLETGGFEAQTDALLEIACVTLTCNAEQQLIPHHKLSYAVTPAANCRITEASLQVTKIDLHDPSRLAITESDALNRLFKVIRQDMKQHGCQRTVLVGHNAAFDLGFLNAAIARTRLNRSPFHPFSTFDTVTLSALAFGQTVLEKAALAAGIEFNCNQAHGALYDAEKTAELFCHVVNRWQQIQRLI